jgi:hypothetical protein
MDPEQIKLYLAHHGYGKQTDDINEMAQKWAADRPAATLRQSGVMTHGTVNVHKLIPAIMQEIQSVQSNTAKPETQDSGDSASLIRGVAGIADDVIPAIARSL